MLSNQIYCIVFSCTLEFSNTCTCIFKNLQHEEELERKAKEEEEKRKKEEAERKKRIERGLETESEQGEEEEEEKEPEPEWHEFVPPEPSQILTGFYGEEGTFWLSMVSIAVDIKGPGIIMPIFGPQKSLVRS